MPSAASGVDVRCANANGTAATSVGAITWVRITGCRKRIADPVGHESTDVRAARPQRLSAVPGKSARLLAQLRVPLKSQG